MRRPTGPRLGRAARWFAALLAATLVSACGNDPSSDDGAVSVDISSAPRTEAPTTEAPRPDDEGTAIEIPSLPIGGNVDVDGAQQCAHVNWLGPTPIPRDVVVSLDGFGLDPSGIFDFGGDLCGSGAPQCTAEWSWAWDTSGLECLVPVTQIAESGPENPVTLQLSGTVSCTDPASCEQFALGGGSQIFFTPEPGVVSGSSPATGATGSGG